MLRPRFKRHLRQIIPFGLIWLFFGFLYAVIEVGLLGESKLYPSTGNKYSFQYSLITIAVGSFIMGLLQGCAEVLWFKKWFAKSPLWKKMAFKGTFYTIVVILFLTVLTILANSLHYETHILDEKVLTSTRAFMGKFAFWSVILYTGAILDIALFYSEIEAYLGNGIMSTYLGKYHRPRKEVRIFMFLDMKSSTSIAEKIGHEKYFELLKEYYADMTEAILETAGEIYQYVGDEIVITWTNKTGVYNNNCIECFRKISIILDTKKEDYLGQFGVIPEFKAGYHIGEVTTGEIGIIKKDMIFTGDVLNTTARIQAECNMYNAKALVSGELFDELQKENPISFTQIGRLALRGKANPIRLYSVNF
ncbi:adenylate/guanylate cyclase domain-containing protein [Maribacter sp. HTCC2170]|uniref:adenylate/guanylate cyclase domain-containing protein n=1 Tax=Maribacter sp. (strain HTCC2170 / KCCM 42371) TaxID=313603 RepID=UPI0002FC57BA|nr:adenylate/guanylate cyclase domain-containing protein [Maribacter sp. HTCC2170]